MNISKVIEIAEKIVSKGLLGYQTVWGITTVLIAILKTVAQKRKGKKQK